MEEMEIKNPTLLQRQRMFVLQLLTLLYWGLVKCFPAGQADALHDRCFHRERCWMLLRIGDLTLLSRNPPSVWFKQNRRVKCADNYNYVAFIDRIGKDNR